MTPLPISLTQINPDEVLRYMGTPPDQAGADLRALVEQCAREVISAARPRGAYRVFDLVPEEGGGGPGVREGLAGGLREELGAGEEDSGGRAETSPESAVRNAPAAPPGRMNPAAASAASPACSSGRRAAVQNTAAAGSTAEQNISPYCRQFLIFCIPPPFNRFATAFEAQNHSRAS